MTIILYLYRRSWKLLLFSSLMGIASGASEAGLAAVVGSGINGDNAPHRALLWAFVALVLTSLIAKTCSAFALIHLAQTAICHLRIGLSRQVLGTPFKQLQSLGVPSLLAMFTSDIATLTSAFQLMPVVFGNSVLIVVCLGYLAWLSVSLFAGMAAILVVGVLLYQWLEKHPLKLIAHLREQTDVLYRFFRDLIEGSKELQLNAERGTRFVAEVIAPAARNTLRLSIDAGRRYTWVDNLGTLMFYIAFGVLLFGSPLGMDQGAETLTRFTVVLLFLIGPIAQLMSSLPLLRAAEISLRRVQQLQKRLGSRDMQSLPHDPFARSSSPLCLELQGVCYCHESAGDELPHSVGPMDLSIQAGEIVFIVGGNGSGKTTLAMLLLGFYEPAQGRLLLNGETVDAHNLGNYRRYLSAVFSDFHLTEQLLLGSGDDIDARAMHYLHKLGIAHKVKVSHGVFSSLDLSAGQRKRLALVSVYLEDRPFLLFDEWAADQDPEFKQVFYSELLPELKARGKAVLAITHDSSYFSYADRVMEIDNGRIRQVMVQSDSAAMQGPVDKMMGAPA